MAIGALEGGGWSIDERKLVEMKEKWKWNENKEGGEVKTLSESSFKHILYFDQKHIK